MTSAVTITVLLDGKTVPDSHLISVNIKKRANKIARAELLYSNNVSVVDGHNDDIKQIQAGMSLTLKARYEDGTSKEYTLFKGIVIQQRLKVSTAGGFTSIVAKDSAFRMTQGRRTQVHLDVTDTDVVKKIAGQYTGISVKLLNQSAVKYPQQVQYQCSDWQFICERCSANSLLLWNDKGVITISKPTWNKASTNNLLQLGISDLIRCDLSYNAQYAVPKVSVQSFNSDKQRPTLASAAKQKVVNQGNKNLFQTGSALKIPEKNIQRGSHAHVDENQALADAQYQSNVLNMSTGKITLIGDGKYQMGTYIKLKGFSKDFDGVALITGIQHTFDHKGWSTTLQFGLHNAIASTSTTHGGKNEAMIPPVPGLQLAVVTEIYGGIKQQYQVQVALAGRNKSEKMWARMSHPQAGKGHGLFLLPEVGDEVVLGFIDNDPRQPVIMGSLYSKANRAPATYPTKKQTGVTRGYVSKAGLALIFDDKQGGISLANSGNSIELNGEEKSQTLVVKTEKNVQFDAKGKMLVISQGDQSLISKGATTIDAKESVKISGKEIHLN
jgi:uncharacterized protein involved in type VI secretion and phage assembly